MSELLSIERKTIDEIGAALKEIKNTTESVKVGDLAGDIIKLKTTATASADKVFKDEEFLGVNGKEKGTFTLENELSTMSNLLDSIDALLLTKKD